jgi:hypothetical protein
MRRQQIVIATVLFGKPGYANDDVLHRHHTHDLFIAGVPDIVSYAHS